MTEFDIRAGFSALQDQLTASLRSAEVVAHGPTKGTGSELNWALMLRNLLPHRYGVASAFVVDVDGASSEQIDVVIHDRHFSPLLFDYGGSLYIPAESVYAVFEVKQDLDKHHVEYASAKVESVRGLRRTSATITHAGGTFAPRPPIPILGGVLATRSSWSPPFGDAFHKCIGGLAALGRLDLGCAAEHGTFSTGLGHDQISVSQASTALSTFALTLLKLLQAVGTVPAMDYDAYLTAIAMS